MDARISPLMLIGLSNYLLELKLDRSSILQKYYQNRKVSFTLEEEEVSFSIILLFIFSFRSLLNLNPTAKQMKLN